ncbi:LPP20 family lipoprotein [Alteromonas antoniana]|uniref:LPP20 family lipoprotein n=1 Tax=Alteromonas antoniana TaxID=2803813 RepID=UPI001C43D3E8|nr:LPP20 family lipoprotein [Alteromonas antoniana]
MIVKIVKLIRLSVMSGAIVTSVALTGCSSLVDKHVEWETVEPESYPVLTAVGYAPIESQRGDTDSVRSLMAMRASKLDAYRELTEQVYGQRIEGNETLANLVVNNTRLEASVEGVIRGAKVVKTYAVGEDTYATELELDMQRVYDIYLTTAKPRRIKEVRYY